MRIYAFSLLFFSLYLMSCTPEQKAITIEPLENGQYSMRYKDISLLIDPKLGGRVLSARFEGQEILLQKREKLLNWGSTFWPSPQSRWNWPPPYAIHFGAYQSEIKDDKLVLLSEIDPEMGLRVKKVFSFHENGKCFAINYEIENATDSIVSVGPWEVTCVPAVGSKVFFKLGASPENVVSTLEFHDLGGIGWFDFDKDNPTGNQKMFSNTPEGWLAHINQNRVLFVKVFDVIPGDQLPPRQGNIEVYTSRQFEYIELENHGIFRQLVPGASLSYQVKWFISILPAQIPTDQPSEALINHVQSIIN